MADKDKVHPIFSVRPRSARSLSCQPNDISLSYLPLLACVHTFPLNINLLETTPSLSPCFLFFRTELLLYVFLQFFFFLQ